MTDTQLRFLLLMFLVVIVIVLLKVAAHAFLMFIGDKITTQKINNSARKETEMCPKIIIILLYALYFDYHCSFLKLSYLVKLFYSRKIIQIMCSSLFPYHTQ